jgi:phenylalanyl-tRNA synthetase alpha chain
MIEMIQTIVNCIDPYLKWRIVETGHPYTLNGVQVDVWWNNQWLEILECGLAHPKILKDHVGTGYYGLALGVGIDRLLMTKKNITDIRLLRSEDQRIKMQMQDLSEYKPVSAMPPVKRDISIIIDEDDDTETIGDMVRLALPNNEMIEEVSILSETHYKDLPQAARDRMKVQPNQKNLLIRIVLRSLERTLTGEECNDYRNAIYDAVHQGEVLEISK